MTHQLDSGIAAFGALLSTVAGAATYGVAQVANSPDWLSLILGPAGGLVIGFFFLKHSISQAKENKARADALDTKLIEVLERTASLAGRNDERLALNTVALDRVNATIGENTRALQDLREDKDA